MEEQIVIYKIVNLLNNKIYIGQTKNFRKRKYYHILSLNKGKSRCRRLQNSWSKHGESSFKFEIIENCTLNNLSDREIYWIDFYNSTITGYNLEKGGRENKELSQETKKLMSTNNPRTWKGRFGKDHNTSKPIFQYSLDGTFIKEFENGYEASRILEIPYKSIQTCASGVTKSGAGYQWSYIFKDNINEYSLKRDSYYQEKPVNMLDNSGNILQTFKSAADAQRFLNKGKNKIFEVCKGNRSKWAGYKWEYKI